jgi:hypothetical protein
MLEVGLNPGAGHRDHDRRYLDGGGLATRSRRHHRDPDFETGTKGIFAIGGAISPTYILIEQEGVLKETKHSNLIYMAIKDGVRAVQAVADRRANA